MDTNELELLKKVLPEGYEVVNENVVQNGQAFVCIYNGDDWQHPIAGYQTAKQVLDKILVTERAWSKEAGRHEVQNALMQTLGVKAELERAITTAVHAAMR